jgi:Trk K+ transport system NAD-binding subunit
LFAADTMLPVQAEWLTGDDPDADRRRFVVCGDNPLTLRLVDELVTRYGAEVVVILPSAGAGRGPELARLPGVRLVEAERPTADAFRQADVAGAAALALVNQDDAGNLDAALLAREVSGPLRIVIRMFNANLGAGIRHLLGDCAVLSESAIAAPAFVAATLGDAAPAFLRVPGQPVFVARRDAVPAPDVLCGIAVTEGRDEAELLPADQDRADLVIACSELPAPAPVRRSRRRLRVFALLIGRRLRLIVTVLAALLAVGTGILMWARHVGWWQAAYLTVLSTFGAANPEPDAPVAVQVVGVALTVVSIALVPVLTAAIVDAVVNARLRLASGGLVEPVEGHIVVVGLGNVGSRVVQALHDLGLTVVAVDRDEQARGVALARALQVPVVLGSPTQEQILRAASISTCRALVVVTSDDVNNLETALLARSVNRDARIVLRLFDGDFAERVQRNFHLTSSRSVSYLAAPAFAAAMLGSQVVDVIPVRRRVILVAELSVDAGSAVEGRPVAELNQPHETRLLGIRTGRGEQTLWSPPGARKLLRTDRLIVLASRAGLGWLLDATTADATRNQPAG